MSTLTLLGAPIEVDAEGFLQKPEQWNEDLGLEIARQNGIPDLNDRHWLVIRFMRDTYLKHGTAPTIRTLGKDSGVPVKELYQLFPKGPAKLAAKIGGIPKPKLRYDHNLLTIGIARVELCLARGSHSGHDHQGAQRS